MDKPTNALTQSTVANLATVATIKSYIKYLVNEGIATTPDAVKAKIGPLCSAAIERGTLTQVALDEIYDQLPKSELFLQTKQAKHSQEQFIGHALFQGVTDNQLKPLTGEDAALFNEAKELMAHLMEIRNKLINKYGDLFLGQSSEFYNQYQKLFDAGYSKKAKQLFNPDTVALTMKL